MNKWFTKVGSSVCELELKSSFSVYAFEAASSIFSGCTMTTTRLEDISSIADGSVVNVEGIVSWIAGNKKEFCIGSNGGVQVLCKAWGRVPANPLLQKRAIIKIGNAIVKNSEQLKSIICAELSEGVAYPDNFTDLQC